MRERHNHSRSSLPLPWLCKLLLRQVFTWIHNLLVLLDALPLLLLKKNRRHWDEIILDYELWGVDIVKLSFGKSWGFGLKLEGWRVGAILVLLMTGGLCVATIIGIYFGLGSLLTLSSRVCHELLSNHIPTFSYPFFWSWPCSWAPSIGGLNWSWIVHGIN